MSRANWPLISGVAAFTASVFLACGSQTPPDEPTLTLRITPRQLPADGTEARITVEATAADGSPGTGPIELSAIAGSFDGAGPTGYMILANGTASAVYGCNAEVDIGCTGTLRITAAWNDVTAVSTVVLSGGQPESDGGISDGGTDAGSDGGNPDGGTTTGDGGVTVQLRASKSPIFYNLGDKSVITATVTRSKDQPVVDEELSFTASFGGLTPIEGGNPQPSLKAQTDADGKAQVVFVETGVTGDAVITATHGSSASASTTVKVTNIQQATWVSTKCSGANCTIMGTRGSGFNEQAQVTFKITDISSKPVAGVPVSFSIPLAPSGTIVSPTGVTDSAGLVTANVSAGATRGAFTVKAEVIPGQVEAESTTIGIRGAKPSNQGFAFSCATVNIAAYADPVPPKEFNVTCDFRLVDRLNNPVGTGTDVFFLTEAGSIPNAAKSKAFNPTGNNTDEGTGAVVFSTKGGEWPPADVVPLVADPGQFPNGRDSEPSYRDGALTRNPRDGLVTIIAAVRGEEWFSDTNNNGIWNPGEQFIDQGEPLVDSNDNGVWDLGENYLDENANGVWDPPNGTWDANSTVWAEARILVTGRADPANAEIRPNPFSGTCGAGLPKATSVRLDAWFPDLNLNRVQAATTSFAASHTATKGSVTWDSGGLLDGYGFGIERIKIDATTLQECAPSSTRCIWRTQFYGWGAGYSGSATVKGAAASDTKPCEADMVKLSVTTLNQRLETATTGAIE